MAKTSTKFKAITGIGGVAAALALTATPAFAAGTISSPSSPYTMAVDVNGNPTDFAVTGAGWNTSVVYAEVCDGKAETTPGWSPQADCDDLTQTPGFAAGTDHASPGQVLFDANWDNSPSDGNFTIGVFQGMGPNDQFNCLGPSDDPTSSTVTVSNPSAATSPAAIDPNVPSWGGSTVYTVGEGGPGGGTAPCQIRLTTTPTTFSSTDQDLAIKFAAVSSTPPPSTPESPLTIALPAGAVALFGAAGLILFRKRRSASSAA
jgi:hypothetical protein